jgi:uncharacterized protein DUF6609
MARRGGLFLVFIGTGLIGAIVFRGDALVNYNFFFVGVACATIALFVSGRLSTDAPTRIQTAALAFAIALEVILIVLQGRMLPHDTPERTRWLWMLIIVGLHFVPMALSFGPAMLWLAAACIANAALGLMLAGLPFEISGLVDGCLKVAVGGWLLFRRGPRPAATSHYAA